MAAADFRAPFGRIREGGELSNGRGRRTAARRGGGCSARKKGLKEREEGREARDSGGRIVFEGEGKKGFDANTPLSLSPPAPPRRHHQPPIMAPNTEANRSNGGKEGRKRRNISCGKILAGYKYVCFTERVRVSALLPKDFCCPPRLLPSTRDTRYDEREREVI